MTTTSKRRQQILQLLMEHGNVQVSELSLAFNVSTVTIRNDLTFFEEQGLVTRTYGGAYLKSMPAQEHNMEHKLALNAGIKERIGAKAAEFIRPGENILIDSGTTTHQLAKYIKRASGITVMTNGLNIASELADAEGVQVMCTGGVLRKKSWSFQGVQAEQSLNGYHFDKVFLGVDGFDIQQGITTHDESEARLNRKMVESARMCIVVTDSSKFGRIGLHRIIPVSKVGVVITDRGISADYREALARMEIDVVLVD